MNELEAARLDLVNQITPAHCRADKACEQQKFVDALEAFIRAVVKDTKPQ